MTEAFAGVEGVQDDAGGVERTAAMRHHGGLGLGLYVVRETVEARGGTIHVVNVPTGGARFTVRPPRTVTA
ncbi:MAG: ATP-binding protein [Myxococcota bacterium]